MGNIKLYNFIYLFGLIDIKLILLQKNNGSTADCKNTHPYEVIQFETPELDVFLVKLISAIHVNMNTIWYMDISITHKLHNLFCPSFTGK